MLALKAWSGLTNKLQTKACVKLVSKLGGNVVGTCAVRQENESLEAFTQRVQKSVATFMPHELGLTWHCVVVEFGGTTRQPEAFAMWDEEIAKQRILHGSCTYGSYHAPALLRVGTSMQGSMESNIKVFKDTLEAVCHGHHQDFDLTHLLSLPKLCRLKLRCMNLAAPPKLPSILDQVAEVGNLAEFSAYDCSGQTWLPRRMGNLTNLAVLNVSRCHLVSMIPETIQTMKHLRRLDLSNNDLTGTIPLGLGELASLELLNLSFNKLSGVVPTSIKNLVLLNSLYLFNNDLTGSIPSCLGELTSMLYMDLSFNKLSGMVPTSLGNLTSMEFLDLSDNQLTGNIPKEINLLTNLQVKQF